MPSSATARPSHRIQQVLDDFDALEAYLDLIESAASNYIPAVAWTQLPARPPKNSIVAEKTRQQLTGSRVKASRQYRARDRARSDQIQVEDLGLRPEDMKGAKLT